MLDVEAAGKEVEGWVTKVEQPWTSTRKGRDDGINKKKYAGKRDLRTLLWTLCYMYMLVKSRLKSHCLTFLHYRDMRL